LEVWETTAMLRGKFVAMSVYIEKSDRSKINKLYFQKSKPNQTQKQ
jgi:hypothetical protein